MRLAKVTAGHWKDQGSGPDFSNRYKFAEDCISNSKIAIGFTFGEGHPFDKTTTTKQIEAISTTDLKAEYEKKGIKEGRAKNASEQIVRFRDWPVGTPLIFYLGRNKVYRLGYLKGEYEFIWNSHFNGEYGYPHIRTVEWMDTPGIFDRNELPEEFQGWLTNPQTALDYDVQPRSEGAEFLSLALGLGQALSGLSEGERSILR